MGHPEQLVQSLTHELSDLGSAIDLIGHTIAGPLGVQQADLMCLNLLAREGPMSPGQVASTLGLTTATVSAMATRLEAGGLAFRREDPADRRQVLMQASPSGSQHTRSIFADYHRAAAELAASLDEQDLRRLIDVLASFRRIITDHAITTRT
jgi:DNA-binding MarR family transcriptional regulator